MTFLFSLSFSRGGRFARALQTDHHDDGRRRDRQFQPTDFRTEHLGETVVDDLDHLLAGRDRFQNRLAYGLLGDLCDEILDDGQCDIGFEQCNPHFAHRAANIIFSQRATTAQLVEYSAKAVAQFIKHITAFPSKQPVFRPTQKAPVGETSLTDV